MAKYIVSPLQIETQHGKIKNMDGSEMLATSVFSLVSSWMKQGQDNVGCCNPNNINIIWGRKPETTWMDQKQSHFFEILVQ